MKRFAFGFLALTFAACGGGEPAADEPMDAPAAEAPAAEAPAAEAPAMPAGEMMMPEWYTMDGDNVTLNITAGATDAGNYWNFNGYQNGDLTIAVPVGANVTLNFQNDDPNMPHSIGVGAGFDNPPATLDPTPVFEGAISTGATMMPAATQPNGGQETISFVASEAGEYVLVCYIPAHAVSGMWIRFVVSADGDAGAMIAG